MPKRNPLIKVAEEQYERQQYPETIATLTKAINEDSENPELFFQRGYVYYQLGDYKNAEQDLISSFARDDEDEYPSAYYLAEMLFKNEKLQEAIPRYRDALANRFTKQAAQKRLDEIQKKLSENAKDQELDKDGEIVQIKPFKPEIKFKDVVGLDEVKKYLEEHITFPLKHPELIKKYGGKARMGLILYGPPGNGKTYIAKAIAGEIDAYFLIARQNQIENKWMGSTRKNLMRIFEQARKHTPCVLFIDEFEALAGKRNSSDDTVGEGSAKASAVNELLQQLDGVDTSNDNIYIMAATNRPYDVDSAIKRSGRFNEMIYIPPPTKQERAALFQLALKNSPTGKIDYKRLARATINYATADITNKIVPEAINQAALRHDKTGKETTITTRDILQAIKKRAPKTALDTWYRDTEKEVIGHNKVEWIDNKAHITTIEGKFNAQEREDYKVMVDDIAAHTRKGIAERNAQQRWIARNLF